MVALFVLSAVSLAMMGTRADPRTGSRRRRQDVYDAAMISTTSCTCNRPIHVPNTGLGGMHYRPPMERLAREAVHVVSDGSG
jgi:hypothetical protein